MSFADPLHRIDGLTALEAYFAALYENVTACRFDFHERQRLSDVAFVTWTMTLAHHRLAGGKEITVEGASRLVFAGDGSGRVCEHRDYFDAGALLYERLPLLRPLIRWLKRRAAGGGEATATRDRHLAHLRWQARPGEWRWLAGFAVLGASSTAAWPWLAAAGGATSGPLSYYAGARLPGVTLPPWLLVAEALCWAGLCLWLCHRLGHRDGAMRPG